MPEELARNAVHECVGAIIVQGESILLGRRSAERDFYPNVWDVFGGHVEPGESCEGTLQRELREELGIVPTASHYLETLCDVNRTTCTGIRCHFYVVTAWRGTPKNQELQEHSDIRWFRYEEITHLELAHPEYIRILQSVKLHLLVSENNFGSDGA